MLNQIYLKNFKAHAETKIEVRRLTLLIGPNNSGKSSLSQALLLLRQAASRGSSSLTQQVQRKPTTLDDPYLFAEDQLIDLGDFGHVARRGEREISIGVAGHLQSTNSAGLSVPLVASLEVGVRQDMLVFHKGLLGYSFPPFAPSGVFAWDFLVGQPQQQVPPPVSLGGAHLQFVPVQNFHLLVPGNVTFNVANVSTELARAIQDLQQNLPRGPLSFLNSLHPIFPLRGLEERGSPLTDIPARNLERMSVADRTVALLSMLAYDLDLQARVSEWLEKLVQIRIKVPLLPGKRVTLMSVPLESKSADSLFTNEGTGANQLPFILVPIGITPRSETVLLTEPEAHLHPKLQSKLASLLLNLAQTENRQFVVETHSEHILQTVLQAVAKGDLSTKDLAIYYFQKHDEIAECRLLEVSDKGQIPGGLPEFFEHSLFELSEFLEAQKKN
jgi:energy-coupling factor transporter ATP-binding protein EcfA2